MLVNVFQRIFMKASFFNLLYGMCSKEYLYEGQGDHWLICREEFVPKNIRQGDHW